MDSEKIITLWTKYTLLSPSLEVDFFESGGDSLSAINMIVEFQKMFGVEISLENFMRNPSINFLLKTIENVYIKVE